MGLVFHPGALLALLSGLALVAVGLVALRVRPFRWDALTFGAFATLWGAVVVLANASRMTDDPDTALALVHAFLAPGILLYLPLLGFVATYPTPPPWMRPVGAWLAVLALPGLLLLLLFLSEPSLFVAGVSERGGRLVTDQGPLFQPLTMVDAYLVFAVALVVALVRLARTTEPTLRDRLAILAAAFLLFTSYASTELVDLLWLSAEGFRAALGGPAYALRVVVVAALALATAGTLAYAAARPMIPRRRAILAAGILPAAVGLLEALVANTGVRGFDTVGLWRLGMVGLFAYGIVRYRIFDVDVRLRRAGPWLAYTVAVLFGVGLAWGVLWEPFTRQPLLGASTSLGLALVALPMVRTGFRRLDRQVGEPRDPDELYRRKLEVYRAALEEAQQEDQGDRTQQRFLGDLRRRLEVSEEEHRVLLAVLQGKEPMDQGVGPGHGKFEVLEELGSGSFGRALKARDTTLDRLVVLKEPFRGWLLDDRGRALFEREARLAAQLNHANVVGVHEVLLDRDPPLLVLEYVEGGSLQDLVERQGPLPARMAASLMVQALQGLAAIHEAGIVHRDLKPANLLLTPQRVPKIADFGVARPPEELRLQATLAATGGQPGTLPFMSPEQVDGQDPGPVADLYAVGAMLHYTVTASHYLSFDQGSVSRIKRAIREDEPPLDDPRLPAPLRAVLARALAKDPDRRFPSAQAMAQALAPIADP